MCQYMVVPAVSKIECDVMTRPTERLWRSVKYEEIYLREHATLPELITGLEKWFGRYNRWRPHQALGNRTPEEVHRVDGAKSNNMKRREGVAA